MQGLRRTHRYPIAQDLLEYEEGWYGIFERLKRIRSIRDSTTLAEDVSMLEGWHMKEVDVLDASEV